MATRDDIIAIVADAEGDKLGRIARLRAQRLGDRVDANLPFIWQPRTNVTVSIKNARLRLNAIEFLIDLTIFGTTQSLSTWIEGRHSPPDWRVTNAPSFHDDPAGAAEIPFLDDNGVQIAVRRGHDDFTVAMRQAFVDTFGNKIAAIVRGLQ